MLIFFLHTELYHFSEGPYLPITLKIFHCLFSKFENNPSSDWVNYHFANQMLCYIQILLNMEKPGETVIMFLRMVGEYETRFFCHTYLTAEIQCTNCTWCSNRD